jgi:hypothetical protein
MFETYMVNWSGRPIPEPEMHVMRRVAVQMRTVFEAKEVSFTHEVCDGLVRFEKDGVFGSVGGLFFFGDFGEEEGRPNTVDFFIPRKQLHWRASDEIIIGQTSKFDGVSFVPLGLPDDISPETARGAGELKITVRKEV